MTTTETRLDAARRRNLKRANRVRSERAALLGELRRGAVRFYEFDLDAPVLQGMTVVRLAEHIRVRSDVSTVTRGGYRGRHARRIVRAFGCGPTTVIGDLSPSRKAQLRNIVAALISSQRPPS
jgi:hypothetical protein